MIRRFHGFWFIEMDPFILRLYRSVLGCSLLLFYIMLAPSWLQYYGPDSVSLEPLFGWPGMAQYLRHGLFGSVLQYFHTETGRRKINQPHVL